MFVKICGITNIQDAYACIETGADAIGLNFYPKSKRFIRFDDAAAIVREVSAYATTVGVMVQPTIEEIAEAIDATEVDALQVYEPKFETADFDFKKLLYYTVRVKKRGEVKAASKVGADLIFLDSFTQSEFGGTGKISDWDEIVQSGVDLSTRFVISGGLNSQNVCDAIKRLNPYGVDTASGVESTPGKKDHGKIREFVSNAKQCGNTD
ncbi:MAG TPA: phosphoribosylanthranilate isomerase [Candidatus Acidoferrales bacterium]|nr:phosphoribosylanthranilate isomerase [Candidatus Acidoferrales bacterium]